MKGSNNHLCSLGVQIRDAKMLVNELVKLLSKECIDFRDRICDQVVDNGEEFIVGLIDFVLGCSLTQTCS